MTFSVLFYKDYFLMLFTVFVCFSATYLIPACTTHLAEETNRYECGAHGKFEYCIDGFPACVIGCHCHPGYYFDTETKICEPNTKLTEDFRRRYIAEPTNGYPTNSPSVTEYIPTHTTTNALDEKVDEIAKDTDDLGDWLYNQFFKTIENQVINGTSEDQPTRRASNDLFRPGGGAKRGGGGHKEDQSEEDTDISEIKKRARKSFRGRGKKKKSKVHGLRRKLLRITEDDSLFDSESNSDSGEDSDSDSSGSTSSNEERKSKEVPQKKDKNKDDREHGHKKVIIFNRRPRPPLPSFIFVPSMDTPYYPPIGLPPPPVMPMYPMVPVPPMAPFFPFIENKNESCASTSTTTTTTTSKPSAATDTNPTENDPTTEATEATEEVTAEASEPSLLRNNKHSRQKSHRVRRPPPPMKSSEEKFFIRSRDLEPNNALTSKQAEQIKLVHKLRERLKMKNKQAPIHEHIGDPGGDTPLLDDNAVLQSLYPYKSKHKTQKYKDERINDVNFKYISELIHRANLSEPKPPEVKEDFKKNLTLQKTRRNDPYPSDILNKVETTTQKRSHEEEPDDAYYTNLGRQIASLVRNVKTKSDSDIATEQNSHEDAIDYLINVNRHMPRSFWERSVRSPLTTFKNYFDRLHFDKHSSEKNLFSLENEVNTFASTARPLTLQDLENILSTLQIAESETKTTKKSTDQSNASFNVNLLPNKPEKTDNSFRRSNSAPDYPKYIPRTIKLTNITNTNPKPPNRNLSHYLHPTNIDLPMIDDWIFDNHDLRQTINLNPQSPNQQVVNTSLEHEGKNYKTKQMTKAVPIYKNINKQNEYLKFLKSMPMSLPHNSPKNPEPSIKYDGMLAKYSNQPDKYNGWRAEFPEQPTNLGELPPKQPEQLNKYPESFLRRKYQSSPTIVNYKTLNFFTDSENKHQYMFEASYPFQLPNYKSSFPKRSETGSGNPSYFHHELHHFDYFD